MSLNDNKKTYKWGMWLLTVAFSIFIFCLNRLHLYMPGDDFMFMLKMPADGSMGFQRITSVSDFAESLKNIYYTCHYRVLVHALIQFFLLLPSWVFDLFNTAAYLLICYLVIPSRMRKEMAVLFPIILFFIWTFHPDLGNAYFWTTGAFNYSWTLIPLLIYINALVDVLNSDEGNNLLLISSPFVASANENALISLFIVSLYVLWRKFKTAGKFNMKLLGAILILLAGGLIMVFSPSATARMAREASHFESFETRFLEFFKRSAFYLLGYIPVLILLLFSPLKKLKLKESTLMLIAISLLSILTMIVVPIFEMRSSVFGFFILTFACLDLIGENLKIRKVVLSALILITILTCFLRFPVFKETYQKVKANYTTLNGQKGYQNVSLDRQCLDGRRSYHICYEIGEKETYINQSLRHFYNIETISLKPEQSKKHNWKTVKNQIEKTDWKNRFSISEKGIYYNRTEEGLHLVFPLEGKSYTSEVSTILRGRRKKSIKHFALQFLPQKIKIFFYDFLEYTGTYYLDKESVLLRDHNGRYFAYQYVYNDHQYNSYLFSLYSLNDHNIVGDILTLDAEQFD